MPAKALGLGINFKADQPTRKLQTDIGPRIDGDFITDKVSNLRTIAPLKKRLIGVSEYEGLLFRKLIF